MKKFFKLQKSDLLEENHFPVQAVFNSVSDSDFVERIEGISYGRGFCVDYGACTFPSDLDDYDIATRGIFEGVEFGLHNGEEVTLNYVEFFHYLKVICESYLVDYPQDRGAIKTSIENYRNRYQIQD